MSSFSQGFSLGTYFFYGRVLNYLRSNLTVGIEG